MIFIGVYHLLRSIIVNDKNLSCNIAHDSLKWFVCGWKPVDLHDSNFSFLIGEVENIVTKYFRSMEMIISWNMMGIKSSTHKYIENIFAKMNSCLPRLFLYSSARSWYVGFDWFSSMSKRSALIWPKNRPRVFTASFDMIVSLSFLSDELKVNNICILWSCVSLFCNLATCCLWVISSSHK